MRVFDPLQLVSDLPWIWKSLVNLGIPTIDCIYQKAITNGINSSAYQSTDLHGKSHGFLQEQTPPPFVSQSIKQHTSSIGYSWFSLKSFHIHISHKPQTRSPIITSSKPPKPESPQSIHASRLQKASLTSMYIEELAKSLMQVGENTDEMEIKT
jgi:hypothetical protein